MRRLVEFFVGSYNNFPQEEKSRIILLSVFATTSSLLAALHGLFYFFISDNIWAATAIFIVILLSTLQIALIRIARFKLAKHFFLITNVSNLAIYSFGFTNNFDILTFFFTIPLMMGFFLFDRRIGLFYAFFTISTFSVLFWGVDAGVIKQFLIPVNSTLFIYPAVLTGMLLVIFISIIYEKERTDNNKKLEDIIKKLTETKAEVELQNQELKEIAYSISHDVKAPIKSIQMIYDLLKRKLKNDNNYADEEAHKLIDMIDKKCNSLANVADGILSYGMIDFENKEVVFESGKTLNEIIGNLIIDTEVTIVFVNSTFPTLKMNENKFIQIFQNLISNSIKYNDKEQKTIEINYIKTVTDLVFTVKDNGMGFDPKYTDRIFKLFQTLGPKSPESSGVGLAIVKKTVDSLQGKILVESTPGKGTFFSISFPQKFLQLS